MKKLKVILLVSSEDWMNSDLSQDLVMKTTPVRSSLVISPKLVQSNCDEADNQSYEIMCIL